MRPNEPTDTDVECDRAADIMQVSTGGTGVFLGCSGYALPPKERCTNTMNLISGDEVVDVEQDDEGESKLLRHKRKCPVCRHPWTAIWSTSNASCTFAATTRIAGFCGGAGHVPHQGL